MADDLVAAAGTVTLHLLQTNVERLRHSVAVAARAQELAITVAPADVDTLVAAAWLHDIGYSPRLHATGCHAIDGAEFLRRQGWPDAVCALVAHHSGNRYVAPIRGLEDRLARFDFVEDAVSDALTTADNTAGPNGRLMTLGQRLHEKMSRHGPGTPNERANPHRDVYIRAAAARVAQRLAVLGCTDPALDPAHV